MVEKYCEGIVPRGTPTDLDRDSKLGVLKRTVREFREDNLTDWAAALTYYALMSLFPAALLAGFIDAIAGGGGILSGNVVVEGFQEPAVAIELLHVDDRRHDAPEGPSAARLVDDQAPGMVFSGLGVDDDRMAVGAPFQHGEPAEPGRVAQQLAAERAADERRPLRDLIAVERVSVSATEGGWTTGRRGAWTTGRPVTPGWRCCWRPGVRR